MEKKKHKSQSFKKMKDDITRVDSQTFYVKGSQPDPYMVFNSVNEGWICDCMSFVMGMTDTVNRECKHILRIKKEYSL